MQETTAAMDEVSGHGPISTELRRGVISLAVLMCLRSENHGYGLRQALSQAGMPLKEGTIYPLLRRLEQQGALASRWDASGKRARKYYSLSAAGRTLLLAMKEQRALLIQVMDRLTDVDDGRLVDAQEFGDSRTCR
jgi:PadR family transcriptional regulator, regulatory protein PadR